MQNCFSKVTRALVATALLGITHSFVQADTKDHSTDPHYTKVGFFDVHYCEWNVRPDFFLVLFGTNQFMDIKSIEVFRPDGSVLGKMDLNRYRLVERKGKPIRRVFIMDAPAGDNAQTGWYTTTVTMKDGSVHQGKDFVYIMKMGLARNISPPHKSENIAVPKRLSWDPVPGAKYYKVFIRDLWEDGKLIFDSGLLSKPYLELPAGLLGKGGWYEWDIHARDVNEHVLLGDFNHGSNVIGLQFTTGDQ